MEMLLCHRHLPQVEPFLLCCRCWLMNAPQVPSSFFSLLLWQSNEGAALWGSFEAYKPEWLHRIEDPFRLPARYLAVQNVSRPYFFSRWKTSNWYQHHHQNCTLLALFFAMNTHHLHCIFYGIPLGRPSFFHWLAFKGVTACLSFPWHHSKMSNWCQDIRSGAPKNFGAVWQKIAPKLRRLRKK